MYTQVENIQRLIIKENEEIPTTGNVQIVIVNEDNIEQEVRFYSDGLLHREDDLPAVYNLVNGTTEWFINGQRHRKNNLPAILHSIGLFEFWENGKRHRTNGPAIHHLGEENNIWVREFESCIVYNNIDNFENIKNLYSPGALFAGNEYWLEGEKISKEEFGEATKI